MDHQEVALPPAPVVMISIAVVLGVMTMIWWAKKHHDVEALEREKVLAQLKTRQREAQVRSMIAVMMMMIMMMQEIYRGNRECLRLTFHFHAMMLIGLC